MASSSSTSTGSVLLRSSQQQQQKFGLSNGGNQRSSKKQWSGVVLRHRQQQRFKSWQPVLVRAEEEKIRNEWMTRDGPAQGGRWLSSTTRHVRLYAANIDPVTMAMDQTQIDKLSLMLDPDNEFLWPEEQEQKVYRYLEELVEQYEGAPLDEYTLRLIGSHIEHFIRKLLLAGEIKYNLDCRVLNFSMGRPRLNLTSPEEEEEDE